MPICSLKKLDQKVRDDCLLDAIDVYSKNENDDNLNLIKDVIEFLEPSDKAKEHEFINAIGSNKPKLVKTFLESKIDITKYQKNALKLAVLKGEYETIELLLKAGADVKVIDHDLLIYNVRRRRMEVINLLRKYGAQI